MTALPTQVDLHTHSNASDGTLTPTALLARAAERGVQVLALTDHDTTYGLAEASAAARRHGVRFVSGIELSVQTEGKPLHIVGLSIDPNSAAIHSAAQRLNALRTERAQAIALRLEKLGFSGAYTGACGQAGRAYPGRPHFARWLMTLGRFTDPSEVFDRLLSRGKAAYVATEWPKMEDGVGAIRAAGGVAVLAHPTCYKLTATWLRRIAAMFQEAGGQGIEVVVARQSRDDLAFVTDIARRYGLLGSVGSDFHSPGMHGPELGTLPPLPPGIEPICQRLSEFIPPNTPSVVVQ